MKHFSSLLFTLLFSACNLFASNEPYSGSARSTGLGTATLTFSDAYSVLNNQAAMAFQKNISFALFAEQRYLENELGYYAGGITIPTKSGAFGLCVNYNGFDLYNENKIGLSYALLFTKNISGGIQFDYLSTSIAEYGNTSTFTFEAGLVVKISDQLNAAAHIFNPVAIKSGFDDEKVPTVLQLGLSYDVGKKVLLSTEVEKSIDYPARVKAGIEYKIIDALHLRGGIRTNPSQYSFGAGINVKNLKIDFATSYHQVLGITPAFSLNYVFDKKKK